MRHRTRTLYVDLGDTQTFTWSGGSSWTPGTLFNLHGYADQEMYDDPHRGYPALLGRFNVGGSMLSTKRSLYSNLPNRSTKIQVQHPTIATAWRCVGQRVPSNLFSDVTSGGSNYPAYPIAPTNNEMNGWGTSGVNRTIPTSPSWNAAQFIGELHQKVPSLPGVNLLRNRDTRSAAGELLNYEFGIKPTVADMATFLDVVNKSEDRLAQLQRDSGRKIRRRIELINESVEGTPVVESKTLYPQAPTWAPASMRTTTVTTTTHSSRRVWFSGCFTYYFRRSENPLVSNLQRLKHEYGVDLTPELLWNLTPWTWLVDWHSNIGEVMGNLSRFANDGLAMRWGYIMCHQISTKTYSWAGNSVTLVTERKSRQFAYPYGFATDLPSYSGRQMAILSALGIARGPNFRF
jgi:hypothetical protein